MTALLAAAGVFAAWSVATAQTPGQADFDACNREAQSAIGSGSASPGTGGTGGTSARPSMGPGAGRGSSGTTDGMGSSGTTGGAPSGGGPMGGASGTGSATGSTGGAVSGGAPSASDAQLQGMASAGLADPAYQQAYRDCMKRRGF